MQLPELNWKIVQVTGIALLAGVSITFLELLIGMPVSPWVYVLSGGIPLLMMALWLWRFPKYRYNHYIVMLGLISINVAVYYFADDWVLFFVALFAQAMISLYQNRSLLWVAVGLQVFLFTLIFYTDSQFVATMPKVGASVGSTMGDVYSCLVLGGIFFNFLTTYIVRLTRRSEYGEKVRQILDAAMEAVVGIDEKGRITSWNPLAESLFGWTSREAQGQVLWPLIAPEAQQEALPDLVRSDHADGEPARGQRLEIMARNRDGRRFPVDLSVVVVESEDGSREQVAFMTDISERKRYEEELVTRANHDGLTGLLNYREFQERLRQEVERAHRYGHPLSLLMLDLDHFKEVNDTYGHVEGDAVLKTLGKILQDFFRSTDVVARWGGEEFALLLPHVGLESAQEVAERLRFVIEGHHFVIGGQRIPVTVSIGVSALGEEMKVVTLVESSDRALYAAKLAGRNRVAVETP